MLSKRNVDHYAQSSKIDGGVAETNVVLTYVLKILSETQTPLLDSLAFKGGTCLRKIYFGTDTRFSMDLDFTSNGIICSEFKDRIIHLLDSKTYYDIRFRVEPYERLVDDDSAFGADVNYIHSWRESNFKLEVSFRESPILPVKKIQLKEEELYWRYCDFQPFKVPCMELEELIAEKLRAAHERTSSRDLYDLYIYSQGAFDEDKVRSMAVLKCWNSKTFFDPALLVEKIQGDEYDWDDLRRLVRPERMPAEREIIERVCQRYSFLRSLDENLTLIQRDAKRHKEEKRVNYVIEMLNHKAQSASAPQN